MHGKSNVLGRWETSKWVPSHLNLAHCFLTENPPTFKAFLVILQRGIGTQNRLQYTACLEFSYILCSFHVTERGHKVKVRRFHGSSVLLMIAMGWASSHVFAKTDPIEYPTPVEECRVPESPARTHFKDMVAKGATEYYLQSGPLLDEFDRSPFLDEIGVYLNGYACVRFVSRDDPTTSYRCFETSENPFVGYTILPPSPMDRLEHCRGTFSGPVEGGNSVGGGGGGIIRP